MDATTLLSGLSIIPVVVIDDPASALPLAEALIDAGLATIEVTLRTPRAVESIEIIAAAFPEACIGAGSVRTESQFAQVKNAGARFAVSPGSSDALLAAAARHEMPFVPGAVTASETIRLQEHGYSLIKFFPAELTGGTRMLQALGAPLPEARFFPTGGITPELAASYLKLKNVACIGGSWIAPINLIAAGDFKSICPTCKRCGTAGRMRSRESRSPPDDNAGTSCLLIGDIGGTNARFALANPESPGFSGEMTLKCRDYESADIAINAYLKEICAPQPSIICIAAAGPVVDGNVRFTNNSWTLNETTLAESFAGARIGLLNDFEAIAYSIPYLLPQECLPVGLPAPHDLTLSDFSIGIVGPGTGLGAAGLRRKDGQTLPIIGEGGHNGFAPESEVQMELLAQLRDHFDRVCDERLVSGPGVVNIYDAFAKIRGKHVSQISAAEIFSLASNNADELAQEAVETFFEILGQVAGNLALTLGAFDGIYIGGGIVARKPELIANSRFRTGFERKGRHRSLMEKIPTQVILHPQPGLLGASYCALQISG